MASGAVAWAVAFVVVAGAVFISGERHAVTAERPLLQGP
jgi:hypothetical protein